MTSRATSISRALSKPRIQHPCFCTASSLSNSSSLSQTQSFPGCKLCRPRSCCRIVRPLTLAPMWWVRAPSANQPPLTICEAWPSNRSCTRKWPIKTWWFQAMPLSGWCVIVKQAVTKLATRQAKETQSMERSSQAVCGRIGEQLARLKRNTSACTVKSYMGLQPQPLCTCARSIKRAPSKKLSVDKASVSTKFLRVR